MDQKRYIWLWVVLGIIFFFSFVISLIFFFINKCISKKASEHYNKYTPNQTTPELYAQSSKYHPKDPEGDLPPLPPRTQFLPSSPEKSYENLAELPDYVQVNDKAPPPYHYTETQVNQDVCRNCDSMSEDYDDIGEDCPSEEDYDDVE
ncbi:hypothetical protein UPYG_G00122720 [Umbra pygmaea]|uniref:Uncharacterized protein n=1 Tax=Umbra pygmaea TaxID=75934 RepID=A0ABD0XSV2_UMBPY